MALYASVNFERYVTKFEKIHQQNEKKKFQNYYDWSDKLESSGDI